MRAFQSRGDVRCGGLDVCPAQALVGRRIEVAGEIGGGEAGYG